MSERDQTLDEDRDDNKIDELAQGIEELRKQQALRHKRMAYGQEEKNNKI